MGGFRLVNDLLLLYISIKHHYVGGLQQSRLLTKKMRERVIFLEVRTLTNTAWSIFYSPFFFNYSFHWCEANYFLLSRGEVWGWKCLLGFEICLGVIFRTQSFGQSSRATIIRLRQIGKLLVLLLSQQLWTRFNDQRLQQLCNQASGEDI